MLMLIYAWFWIVLGMGVVLGTLGYLLIVPLNAIDLMRLLGAGAFFLTIGLLLRKRYSPDPRISKTTDEPVRHQKSA